MSSPTINISSTPTMIATRMDLGSSRIHTRYPSVEIRNPSPNINMSEAPARLDIDWTQTRAEIGLKTQSTFMRYWRDDAKAHAMSMIGRYSAEGDRLAAIENRGDPIADMAWSKALTLTTFNLDALPKTPPAITYYPSDIDFQPSTPPAEIRFRPGEAFFDIGPPRVEHSVVQHGGVELSVSGRVFDFLA